jgi:aromatic-L-amino-acid decarboxylase
MVEIIRNQVAWAQELARWIGEAGDFETLAPHPFSVVCFRHLPARLAKNAGALDQHNQRVVDEINRGGFAFLSTTRLNERVAIRFAIGNARTTPADVRETWDLLLSTARRLASA